MKFLALLLALFTSFACLAKSSNSSRVIINGTIKVSVPDNQGGRFVGGDFTSLNGTARNNVAHLFADNTVDPNWNPNPNGKVDSLVMSNGHLLVLGKFTKIAGQDRNGLASVSSSTGNLLPWNPNPSNFGYVYALVPKGNVVLIAGSFNFIGGQRRNNIAAVDAITGLATNWDPNADRSVRDILLRGNTLYVSGEFSNIGGQTRQGLAALDVNTGLATSWNPCRNRTSSVGGGDLAINTNFLTTTIFVVVSSLDIGTQTRRGIAAIDSASGNFTRFNINGGANAPITAISFSSIFSNTLYVGGRFTTIGGQNRNYLAAVDASTGAVTNWNPAPDNGTGFPFNVEIRQILATSSAIYVSGQFARIGGQSRSHLAALDPVTGLATSWNPEISLYLSAQPSTYMDINQVSAFEIKGNELFAGGLGRSRSQTVAIELTSGLVNGREFNDPMFDPNTFKVSGATLYTGGSTGTKAKAFDLSGCYSTSIASIVGDTIYCEHNGGAVLTSSPNGSRVLWSSVDGYNKDTTQVPLLIRRTSDINVRVVTNGCTTKRSRSVDVNYLSHVAAVFTPYIVLDTMYARPTSLPDYTFQWFLNNQPIPGATSYKYKPRFNGSYRYSLTSTINGCSDTSVATAITSLAKVSKNTTLTLHPNPATTSVQLNLSYGDIKQVEVIDQLGRTLISTKEIEHNTLDISSLATGTYMVRVLTTDGVTFKKMLKQ